MIEVCNLTKDFKLYKKYEGLRGAIKGLFSNEFEIKKAVNDISFSISEGEVVGFLGVNGAGKSTTIKMMSGILVPTSGICKVNGIIPYENRMKHCKNIGVVFGQRTQLWWDLPLSESFSILKDVYELDDDIFYNNINYYKELLGLNEFYLTPVRNLSLGQRMRADLAASMLHNPKVLFFDEPTIGLDIFVKEKIRKSIKEINRDKKTTIILTTHDLEDVEEICNRIIVIDKGCIIYDGSIDEMKKMYNSFKEIIFEIKGNSYEQFDLHSSLGISITDLEVQQKDSHLHISFNRDKVDALQIIDHVIRHYDVNDISILNSKLEEVVKRIYMEYQH